MNQSEKNRILARMLDIPLSELFALEDELMEKYPEEFDLLFEEYEGENDDE